MAIAKTTFAFAHVCNIVASCASLTMGPVFSPQSCRFVFAIAVVVHLVGLVYTQAGTLLDGHFLHRLVFPFYFCFYANKMCIIVKMTNNNNKNANYCKCVCLFVTPCRF